MPSNHIFRQFRTEEHLSQPQFAQMLKIPQQGHVSHYELGRRPVPLKLAYRFLKLARERGYLVALEDVFPEDARVNSRRKRIVRAPQHA